MKYSKTCPLNFKYPNGEKRKECKDCAHADTKHRLCIFSDKWFEKYSYKVQEKEAGKWE